MAQYCFQIQRRRIPQTFQTSLRRGTSCGVSAILSRKLHVANMHTAYVPATVCVCVCVCVEGGSIYF